MKELHPFAIEQFFLTNLGVVFLPDYFIHTWRAIHAREWHEILHEATNKWDTHEQRAFIASAVA